MHVAPEILPAVGYGSVCTLQALAARRAFAAERRDRSVASPPLEPGRLTVLQPILGGDEALEECLFVTASACAPAVKFVWLVDEDDPQGGAAAEAARERLDGAAQHAVEIRVVPPLAVLSEEEGSSSPINPKSAKLALALPSVDTPLVAVLDDDTTVGPEHLSRAARAINAGVDLYTGLPSYRATSTNVGAGLLTGFVNASTVRTYLSARPLGPPVTVNGMFWMTSAQALRELGGFDAVRHELCDDLAVATLYRAAGRTIAQGTTAQVLVTGPLPLGDYVAKMHRWFVFARVLLARSRNVVRVALILFGLGMPLLLWGVLLAAFSGAAGAIAAASVLVLRDVTLSTLLGRAADPSLTRRANVPAIASVAAELLIPFHALHAFLAPTIRWRTRTYRVGASGGFREV